MNVHVDQTIARCVALVKASTNKSVISDVAWYDINNEGLEAEVKLLRCHGEIAHHPTVHTLIRFNEERR